MIKAVDYFVEDISYIKGDVTPVILNIFKNNVAYTDLESADEVKIQIKDNHGTVVRTLSSTGDSPALTVSTSYLTILTTAFTSHGRYRYDVQVTTGSYIETIGKGTWIIQTEVTT